MKILITGAKGMLGRTLCRTLTGFEIFATDRDIMDITDARAVEQVVKVQKPHIYLGVQLHIRANAGHQNGRKRNAHDRNLAAYLKRSLLGRKHGVAPAVCQPKNSAVAFARSYDKI